MLLKLVRTFLQWLVLIAKLQITNYLCKRILFFCAKLFASDVFAWGFFARVCMLFFVLYV